MRLSEAVRQADMMRPNTVPEPLKRAWGKQLEAEFIEMTQPDISGEKPIEDFIHFEEWIMHPPIEEEPEPDPEPEPEPDETEQDDPELVIPEPYSTVYPLYIAAYIDYYQEELELWQTDTIMANAAVAQAKAWYRRNNRMKTPHFKGVFI